MIYEFICKNSKCKKTRTHMVPVAKLDEVSRVRCLECGGKTKRILSVPGVIVKGGCSPAQTPMTNSFGYKGEDVKFGFVDQKGRDGLSKDSVGKRIKGARRDEKTGKMVVDVVSNVKDPLGKLEKMKSEKIKRNIGQKVQRRK